VRPKYLHVSLLSVALQQEPYNLHMKVTSLLLFTAKVILVLFIICIGHTTLDFEITHRATLRS
jgi:hypothetical protein